MRRIAINIAAALALFCGVSNAWGQVIREKVKVVPGVLRPPVVAPVVPAPPVVNVAPAPAVVVPAPTVVTPGPTVVTPAPGVVTRGPVIESWRMTRHGGRYWYWTPGNRWMYYHNGGWVYHTPSVYGPAYVVPY